MQMNIQGHGIELTSPLSQYATKKLEKLQEFYKNIIKMMVVLDVRKNKDIKNSHVADVSIWVSGKKVVHASEVGEDMYAAIDLVYEELKRQLVRHKEKHMKETRRVAEKLKERQRNTTIM
ncbi:ribosomal subunit interface protein [candidate division WOR-1 bacterium RIFOXYD2_FULL_36_8]|uniref:Ribosomal subunit interface protein n=1 Tax=candidate division WOR-1 bacterium RIFOXYB2_FULL_36_35 TaxID=1802578 RepID=A0A1F4RZ75_UNCSA|nr:MAG: ribosomal subunit interface protein [candidate division WOR-1 bacterium RIFOXYA2_FULL_36_21]OGC13459.1 MAG: ribosomal subunit interface protein [candidate division WOR-1 bacterium RIFOXYB2_FULL_36_35]OGC21177.1 MAG: ribosomal subunit interface protein [candidate division WOR-1 bacterium RIFOXYA12_FULL_36_13]OGC40061.1 MAG: ribosomal subunit interface protein [candidate division WOR-1 bacterium RIFOXYD2_FULL_36_8]